LEIQRFARSALSLRLFGEDVTAAAREAAQQNKSGAAVANPIIGETNDTFDSAQDVDKAEVPETELWVIKLESMYLLI
jgi:hypothetical protein